MSLTADEMLATVRKYLGYDEQGGATKFGEWWDKTNKTKGFTKAAWCDMFLAYCAHEAAGEDGLKTVGEFAYTPWHAAWFARNGRFGNSPKKGAIVFFDWAGTKSISAIDHVGIVVGTDAKGRVVTIEGNTSDTVAQRYRDRSTIVGYGYPKYAAKSATPPKPPTVKKPTTSSAPSFPLATDRWFGRDKHPKAVNKGTGVKQLQAQLNKHGWKLAVDGDFGPATDHAVRVFQDHHDLPIDGAVGRKTWPVLWTAAK